MSAATSKFLEDRAATDRFGRDLGERLQPGDVVALVGDLGAGKSALARAILAGRGHLGPTPSPTYAIANRYELAGGPVVHADWYRLSDVGELEQLGWDELVDGAIALIEWADLLPSALPADRLEVRLTDAGDAADGRWLQVVATGPRHAARLRG